MYLSWLIALLVIELKMTCSIFHPKYGFNGVQLKFVVSNVLPFDVITVESDGNVTHTGSNPLLYNWLSKKLNFTISYMIINDTIAAKYGSSPKLMVYLIQNKIVDASSMGFIASPERKKVVDFAYFMWTEPQAMLVPRPEEDSRLFAFIRPFQPHVWLLILVTVLLVVSSMSLISKIYSSSIIFGEKKLRKKPLHEYGSIYFLSVVNTMTNQGDSHYSVVKGRYSLLILVGMWLLVSTVVVNCYSSTIISYLTLPLNMPPINSFEDLAAASNEVKILIRGDFIIGQQIMEAKTGALKILGDQVRQNPNQMVYESSKVIDLLRTGNYAFPFLGSTGDLFIANQFKLDRKCRFLITDPLSMYEYLSVTLQKDSKFTALFNDALIELWETGLPWFWVQANTPQAPQCFAKVKTQPDSTHQMPIRLVDLMGAFLVLFVGIMLSIFAFVMENIFT